MEKELLISSLSEEFRLDEIKDVSLNGLQCDCSKKEIKKIVFAVDACLQSIQAAAAAEADMLFVHHGLFWGKPVSLTASHYRRIKALLDNDIALFAVHLPLDLHPELGNNIQIARTLGLENIEPFGEYHGVKIGFKGTLAKPLDSKECAGMLGFDFSNDLKILNFGKTRNSSVAVISGGAADDVMQAIDEHIDLYITGEHSHACYHTAKEEHINVVSGGHYKSEVFGVRAVCEYVRKMGVKGQFVDIPTGM